MILYTFVVDKFGFNHVCTEDSTAS